MARANEQLIARALRGRGQVQSRPSSASSAARAGCASTAARACSRLLRGVAAAPRAQRDRPVLPAPGRSGRAGSGHGGAMAELVAEGKVRSLGLSEATQAELERARRRIRSARWSPSGRCCGATRRTMSCPPPGGWVSGWCPTARWPRPAHRHPRGRGHRRQRLPPRRPAVSRPGPGPQLASGGGAGDLAAAFGLTPGQLALAWLLAQGADVVPIPGSRRPDRVAENAAAAGVRLGPAELERLARALPRSGWAGDRHSFAVPVTTSGTG